MDNYKVLLDILHIRYPDNDYISYNIVNNNIYFSYKNRDNLFSSNHSFNLNTFEFQYGGPENLDKLNSDYRLKILKRKLKLKNLK